MYKAHIYLETDRMAPQKQARQYGYILVLEGHDRTKAGYGSAETTYHGAVLTAAVEALGQFRQSCAITVHTPDIYLKTMFEENLGKWIENGFVTARGQKVRDAGLWEEMYRKTRAQKITFETGYHKYSDQMFAEMRRREHV